ncbi:hypothetical protein HDU83_005619 [Entophlyctis luteolus]|nr:hypothetical protein HDU83_005619 [Entophlyctis luteolus]
MNFLRTVWSADSQAQGPEYAHVAIPELADFDAPTSTVYGACIGYAAGVGRALLASIPTVAGLKVPRSLALAYPAIMPTMNCYSSADGVMGILGLAPGRKDTGMVLPTTVIPRTAKLEVDFGSMPPPAPAPSPGSAASAAPATEDLYAAGALLDFSQLDAVGSLLEQSISLKPVEMKRSRSLKHFDDEIESIISKEQRDSLDRRRLSLPIAADSNNALTTSDDVPPVPPVPPIATTAATASASATVPNVPLPSPATSSSNSLLRPRMDSSVTPVPVPITPPSTPLAIAPPASTTSAAEPPAPNTTSSGAAVEPSEPPSPNVARTTSATKTPGLRPAAGAKPPLSPTPAAAPKAPVKSPSFLASLFGRRHQHPPASASPVPPAVPLPTPQSSASPAVNPALSAAVRASSAPSAGGILKNKAPASATLSLSLSSNARMGGGGGQQEDGDGDTRKLTDADDDDKVGVVSAPAGSLRSLLDTAPKLELKLAEEGSSGFLEGFKF